MTSSSKPYHHGALRGALVDAAARVAARRGPDALTLREVARHAGVSQAAPYHYFADKSALVAAVAEEGFRLFDAAQIATLEAGPDDPHDRLAELAVSYARFALDRPHYFKVMFRPHLADRARYPRLAQLAGRAFDRLVDAVRGARLAAGHDDVDPHAAAMAVWAVPHGLAMLYLEGPLAGATTPRALETLVRASVRPLAHASLDELGRDPEWGI